MLATSVRVDLAIAASSPTVRLDLEIDRKATTAQVLDALKFLPNDRSLPANWYAEFLAGKFPDDPRYADLFVAVRRFEQLIKNMPVEARHKLDKARRFAKARKRLAYRRPARTM